MADVTVAQFAEVLKVPVDRLLQQLDQAGIRVDGAEDMISEDAKHELLTHLRRSHGRDDVQADAAPRKITLRRKSQSELRLASPQGRARTVNVEVRSKRTYVKREVLEDQARLQQEEIDKLRETEEQAKAALERAEKERLDKERQDRERYDVNLIAYLPQADTNVERGENSGRTLREFNIVRQFRSLGVWNGRQSVFRAPVDSFPADATRVAVLLQRDQQGPIVESATALLRMSAPDHRT